MAGSLVGMTIMRCVLDWHKLMLIWETDPDPTFHFDADPDPDPDPTLKFCTCGKIWSFQFFLSRHHCKCHNFQYFGQYIRQKWCRPDWIQILNISRKFKWGHSESEWQVVTKHLCTVIEPCSPKERARQMSRFLKFQFLRGGKTHFESRWNEISS